MLATQCVFLGAQGHVLAKGNALLICADASKFIMAAHAGHNCSEMKKCTEQCLGNAGAAWSCTLPVHMLLVHTYACSCMFV